MNLHEGHGRRLFLERLVLLNTCLIYPTEKMSIIRNLSPTVHIIFATDLFVQKTVSFYFNFLLIRVFSSLAALATKTERQAAFCTRVQNAASYAGQERH